MLCSIVAIGLALPAIASSASDVGANGNPFTGGLGYTPASVSVTEGDTVTWTNTDILVPHTVTEDHGLFNLAGTYGMTPANPAGFGPGEKRSRVFAAGTFHYFCQVHPIQMHGVVAAAMRLSVRSQSKSVVVKTKKKRKHHKRLKHRKRVVNETHFIVTGTWASQALPADQVFDVQQQRADGSWMTVRDDTAALSGQFDVGTAAGKRVAFRARVRRGNDAVSASDWSPVATIVTG